MFTQYLSSFTSHFSFSNLKFMCTVFAGSTLLAVFVEFVVLGKSSTIYDVLYKRQWTDDFKKDVCIWLMGVFLIWPLFGNILTLSIGVYFGNKLNILASEYFSLKFIPMLHYVWLQILVSIAIGDFVLYWLHRLFHTYEPLWHLHKYHHSTVKMTVFSGARDNPVVGQLWALVTGLPTYILGSPSSVPFWLIFINITHTQIIHSKITHDWGWFGRYIYISPHAHLIHHSKKEEHFNKNFSFMFPVWDHLFGTYYSGKNYDVSDLGIHEDLNAMPIKQIWLDSVKSYNAFIKLIYIKLRRVKLLTIKTYD